MKLHIRLMTAVLIAFVLSACSGRAEDAAAESPIVIRSETSKICVSTEETSENADDIAEKTRDYLINGQDDASADKIFWSEAFLDQVSIEEVYQEYISNGGKASDIRDFVLCNDRRSRSPLCGGQCENG